MDRQRFLQQLVRIAWILFFLVGCGAPGTSMPVAPSPTPAPVGEKPVAGAFQGGNMSLPGGGTFNLLLVVSENSSDVIDAILIACAPTGAINPNPPFEIAADSRIEGGAISATSADVSLAGRFVSPTKAEGTIQALTENARGCGIPDEGTWEAACNMTVEKQAADEATSAPGEITITGASMTTDGGTAYGFIEFFANSGDVFVMERTESGSCSEP